MPKRPISSDEYRFAVDDTIPSVPNDRRARRRDPTYRPGGGKRKRVAPARESSIVDVPDVVPMSIEPLPPKRSRKYSSDMRENSIIDVPDVVPMTIESQKRKRSDSSSQLPKKKQKGRSPLPTPSDLAEKMGGLKISSGGGLLGHQRDAIAMAEGARKSTTMRGGLVWHTTGSGKTISALGIALAFAGTKQKICFVSHRENVSEIERRWKDDIKRFPGKKVPAVDFLTHRMFANRVGDGERRGKWGNNWEKNGLVVIADESHIMIDQSRPNELKQNEETGQWRAAKFLESRAFRENKTSKVFLLSATPSKTAAGLLRSLNIVRPRGTKAWTTPEEAQSSPVFKKIVSYVEKAQLAKAGVYAKEVAPPSDAKLDWSVQPAHYLALLRSVGSNGVSPASLEKCGERMLEKARELEDIMLITDLKNAVKGSVSMKNFCEAYTFDGHSPLVSGGSCTSGDKSAIISPKISAMLHNAVYRPGKQLVYVPRHHAVRQMLDVLKKRYKFEPAPKSVPKTQAYRAIAVTSRQHAADRLKIFDDPANINGQLVKILFISGKYFTGLDVKALRGIHSLVPFVSHTAHKQFEGRGARAFGHHALAKHHRNVTKYEYRAHLDTDAAKADDVEALAKATFGKVTPATLKTMKSGYNVLKSMAPHKKFPMPSDAVAALQRKGVDTRADRLAQTARRSSAGARRYTTDDESTRNVEVVEPAKRPKRRSAGERAKATAAKKAEKERAKKAAKAAATAAKKAAAAAKKAEKPKRKRKKIALYVNNSSNGLGSMMEKLEEMERNAERREKKRKKQGLALWKKSSNLSF